MSRELARGSIISDSAKIDVDQFYLGENSYIGDGVKIKGEYVHIGRYTTIEDNAEIDVGQFYLGDRSLVRSHAEIEGTLVKVGHEAFFDRYSRVGGGSATDPVAYLKAGDWYHQGKQSEVNTARGVDVGHEAGIGIESKIFTHGAYQSMWEGFPVQWGPVKLGNRVWLPNAKVNPGVTIGDDVVVAAGSTVIKDIPSGSLAGGSPATILRENAYPRKLDSAKQHDLFLDYVWRPAKIIAESKGYIKSFENEPSYDNGTYRIGPTVFDLDKRIIEGPATEVSEILKNQMRRNGIRFRYADDGSGVYRPWKETRWE